MSNAAFACWNNSASPLTEGERIEVRGFPTSYLEAAETLTLPSPLERARRSRAYVQL